MIDKTVFLRNNEIFYTDSIITLSLMANRDKEVFFRIIGPIKYAKTEEGRNKMKQSLWDELNDEHNISFAIRSAENDECVGYCQYQLIKTEAPYIGIELLPDYRGKGYGYRACRALADEYFSRSGNDKLLYKVKRDNTASIALVKKLGGSLMRSKYSLSQLYGAVDQIEEKCHDDMLENGRRLSEAYHSGFEKEKKKLSSAGIPEDELIYLIRRC